VYVLTVVGKDDQGNLAIRGLYIGDDVECFQKAAAMSAIVNLQMIDAPIRKAVVYLDPAEFKSTWLGNKSIYRTRMAIADEGELIVLAPGVKAFGEDKGIDKLIRKYGYVTTHEVLDYVKRDDELKNNLSAAAHLIHGSSEKRFRITYCPGFLGREEIESVNYAYADLKMMSDKYNPKKLIDGFNIMPDGEEIFYISNPALGLWAYEERFQD
jgi:nickel-dependent lactate racemase